MPAPNTSRLSQKQVSRFLKPRPQDSHKGMFGTVMVIGGEQGMLGAALLAGRAALKLGAGCVRVGLLAEDAPAIDLLVPELMLHKATDLLQQAEPRIEKNEKNRFTPNVLVVGCGLGQSLGAQKILHDALLLDIPTVVDADALRLIALRPDLRSILQTRKAATVFTPHPGEAADLLACSVADVQADRSAATIALANKLNGSIVLKGAGSLCATQNKQLYLNPTGNSGMSSPGMGDILSGIIAAFIAQGLTADEAMLLGVYLHGAAGDALAQQQATLGMSATEVMEWARWLLNQWLLKHA